MDLNVFFETHDAGLRRVLRYKMMDGPYDGEDAYHDGIVSFLERITTLTNTNPRGYIYRCAINTVYDWRRSSMRHPLVPLLDLHPTGNVEGDAMSAMILDGVLQEIEGLPKGQRDAIVLRMLGFTDQEICTYTDAPHGTVKSRLFRARQALYNGIED